MLAVRKFAGFYKLKQDKIEINGSTKELNLKPNFHVQMYLHKAQKLIIVANFV